MNYELNISQRRQCAQCELWVNVMVKVETQRKHVTKCQKHISEQNIQMATCKIKGNHVLRLQRNSILLKRNETDGICHSGDRHALLSVICVHNYHFSYQIENCFHSYFSLLLLFVSHYVHACRWNQTPQTNETNKTGDCPVVHSFHTRVNWMTLIYVKNRKQQKCLKNNLCRTK